MSAAFVAPGKAERENLLSSGARRRVKDSHRIISKKKCRPPVIIYTHSPKVIHTPPHSFMSLVQKLTGRPADAATTQGSRSVIVTEPFCTKQSISPRSPLESSSEFDSLFSPQLSDPRSMTSNPQMTMFSSKSSSNLFIKHSPGSVPTSKTQMLSHQHQEFFQSPVPMLLSPQGWSQSNCYDADAESAHPGCNPSLEVAAWS